jgi:hypothetical protein
LREAPGSSPGKILFFCLFDIVVDLVLVEEGSKMEFWAEEDTLGLDYDAGDGRKRYGVALSV